GAAGAAGGGPAAGAGGQAGAPSRSTPPASQTLVVRGWARRAGGGGLSAPRHHAERRTAVVGEGSELRVLIQSIPRARARLRPLHVVRALTRGAGDADEHGVIGTDVRVGAAVGESRVADRCGSSAVELDGEAARAVVRKSRVHEVEP